MATIGLKHQMKQSLQFTALSSMLCFGLFGCSSLPLGHQNNKAPQSVENTAAGNTPLGQVNDLTSETNAAKALPLKALIAKASQAQSPQREIYLIQATNKALKENKPKTASKIFETINPIDITSEHNIDYFYHLVGLNLAIHTNDLDKAQARLNDLDTLSNRRKVILSPETYLLDTTLRAEALALTDEPFTAARLLVFRLSGLNEASYNQQEIHNFIWRLLSLHRGQLKDTKAVSGSPIEIGIGTTQAPSHEWQAWLELSDLFNATQQTSIAETQNNVKNWSQNWIMTRVGRVPPLQIKRLIIDEFQPITQLAVLLPSSGPYKHAGKAIQDGIMTAHYNQDSSQPFFPEITFYNTDDQVKIQDIYHQAIADGAQFVIGPLQKSKVSELGQLSEIPTPLLALNYRNSQTPRVLTGVDQLLEFGLKAEDEAEAVAELAWRQGHSRVMILRPQSEWGQKVSNAFIDKWTQLEGKVLKEQIYTQPRAFSKEIEGMLGITESKRRHQQMEKDTGQKLEFKPRLRKDIDFIFLIASPDEGRQLRPTINFHYGEGTPVYATSHIYAGRESQTFDKDLNGVIFADMPWVIDPSVQAFYQDSNYLESNSTQFQRLFALGIDAYRIMQNFPAVRHLNETEIQGTSGKLILSEGKVKRRMVFGIFKNGIVEPYTN